MTQIGPPRLTRTPLPPVNMSAPKDPHQTPTQAASPQHSLPLRPFAATLAPHKAPSMRGKQPAKTKPREPRRCSAGEERHSPGQAPAAKAAARASAWGPKASHAGSNTPSPCPCPDNKRRRRRRPRAGCKGQAALAPRPALLCPSARSPAPLTACSSRQRRALLVPPSLGARAGRLRGRRGGSPGPSPARPGLRAGGRSPSSHSGGPPAPSRAASGAEAGPRPAATHRSGSGLPGAPTAPPPPLGSAHRPRQPPPPPLPAPPLLFPRPHASNGAGQEESERASERASAPPQEQGGRRGSAEGFSAGSAGSCSGEGYLGRRRKGGGQIFAGSKAAWSGAGAPLDKMGAQRTSEAQELQQRRRQERPSEHMGNECLPSRWSSSLQDAPRAGRGQVWLLEGPAPRLRKSSVPGSQRGMDRRLPGEAHSGAELKSR